MVAAVSLTLALILDNKARGSEAPRYGRVLLWVIVTVAYGMVLVSTFALAAPNGPAAVVAGFNRALLAGTGVVLVVREAALYRARVASGR